jgi:hypothetical protein
MTHPSENNPFKYFSTQNLILSETELEKVGIAPVLKKSVVPKKTLKKSSQIKDPLLDRIRDYEIKKR